MCLTCASGKISSALGWGNGEDGTQAPITEAAHGSTGLGSGGLDSDAANQKTVTTQLLESRGTPFRSGALVSAADGLAANRPPRGPCVCVELHRGSNLPDVQPSLAMAGFGQQDPYVLCRLLPLRQSVGRSG